MLQNHFHVILSDLSLVAPGRPWTPLDAPVSKYYFFKCSQNFHPPPSQKVLQNHFQVILSDLSLDAPVRPCMPLRPCVKTRFAWRARAQGRVTPPIIQYYHRTGDNLPPNTTYLAVFGGIWRYLAVFGGIGRYWAVYAVPTVITRLQYQTQQHWVLRGTKKSWVNSVETHWFYSFQIYLMN